MGAERAFQYDGHFNKMGTSIRCSSAVLHCGLN